MSMTKALPIEQAEHITVRWPRFGELARQMAAVRAADIEQCLAEQRSNGGLLGERLIARGLLTAADADEIVARQAQWVARSLRVELDGSGFPRPETLSLCLPAFNEQDNIAATLRSARTILPHYVGGFEIVVVDDGSRDETAKRVAAVAQSDPRVRLIRHNRNQGYGAAVTSGLRAAMGDLVMFADSDGQFNFLDVAHLLVQLRGNDLVVGYRRNRAEGWRRRLNAWAWARLVGTVLGVRLRDLDCAFKLFRRELIERLQMTSAGACINAEIMTQCVHGGLRFHEVPVSHYPRHAGAATGARLKVIARAFGELPALRKYRHQRLPPAGSRPPRARAA